MAKKGNGKIEAPVGVDKQPISGLEWVDRDSLNPNLWNPNIQANTELKLLRTSLLETGWTQPLVAFPDGTIIDGFHRWKVAGEKNIAALTDGKVPVVYLDEAIDQATAMMTTIRHNRARGTHAVLRMADIIRDLKDNHGLSDEAIIARLGMDDEEVDRLYDASGMPTRGGADEFNPAWAPSKES